MNAAQQNERRQLVWQTVSRHCQQWFDAAGNWNDAASWTDTSVKWHDVQTRTIVWLCFGLLPGAPEDVALANRVLERLEFHLHVPARSEAEVSSPFDIFVSNHAVHILTLHADKLSPPARAKLESWGRAGLADYAGNRQCDYQYHGYNDNMPSKATLGMVLGGEYFGDQAAVEHGLWNLRQLRDLLTRRGLFSEYNSPTYTAFTIANLTAVALHACHEEARTLAGQVCERLWAEILGHFHPPTGASGGPFSRAYPPDTLGHLSTLSSVLWLVRGEGIIPLPLPELTGRTVAPAGVLSSFAGGFARALLADGFVRVRGAGAPGRVGRNRTYPYQFRATAERGDGGAAFHAGEIVATNYQEEDFTLGTAEGESWLQAETWYLRYRRKIPAACIEDVRIAYASYLINDQAPNDGIGKVQTHGVMHTLQSGRVALVVAQPVRSLTGREITQLNFPASCRRTSAPPPKSWKCGPGMSSCKTGLCASRCGR